LEICAVIAAIAVGLAVGGWIIGRREARRGRRATVLRAAAWLVAAAPLAVPIAAFASGGAPRGGLDTLPASTIQGIEAGIVGTLGLIGKTHSIELTGTLKRPDAAALQRLNLSGDVLLVQADFAVLIKETALASDAGDFDGDRIPIHVSLVMRHTSG